MQITFNYKPTPKGFVATSDFMDFSKHAGIKAFGKTEENATKNLLKKWNKKVSEDREGIIKSMTDNMSISSYSFSVEEKSFKLIIEK